MDEGTVRMMCGMWAQVAQFNALQTKTMSMQAKNMECIQMGRATKYGERDFLDVAEKIMAIGKLLEEM